MLIELFKRVHGHDALHFGPVIHKLVRRNLDASAGMQLRGQIQRGLKMREYQVGQKVCGYYPPAANQKLKYLGQELMR